MEWYKSTAEGSTLDTEQQRIRTTSAASRPARALRLHPKRYARAKAIRSIWPPRDLHSPHVSLEKTSERQPQAPHNLGLEPGKARWTRSC